MIAEGTISADQARSILDDLIRQRQHMRGESADASLLEANRLGIVYWQWQLSRALAIEHHVPQSAA
jgi:polyhydroxyalkanoate synthesis regulator phasin